MTIRDFKERISNYLLGNAKQKEKEDVDRWLQYVENEARLTLDTGEHHDVRDSMLLIIQKHLGILNIDGKTKHASFPWRLAAAAVVPLILFANIYFFRFPLLNIVSPIANRELTASAFGTQRVILPDSSVVILNSGSKIVYPEKFRGHLRQIHLQGEAFFDVHHDEEHPFNVTSNMMQVQVLGTSFTILNQAHDSVSHVVVITGKVAVSTNVEEPVILLPDQALHYNKINKRTRTEAGITADLRWTSNQFAFKQVAMHDVFKTLAAHYQFSFHFHDDAIGKLIFTGVFQQQDTLPEIIRIISLSHNLNIYPMNNQYEIEMKKE